MNLYSLLACAVISAFGVCGAMPVSLAVNTMGSDPMTTVGCIFRMGK